MKVLAALAAIMGVASVATAVPVLDPTFGSGGFAPTTVSPTVGRTLALQADAKIVHCGVVGVPLGVDLGLVRLLPDGTPDATFGAGGRAVQDLGHPEERPTALAIQPDGRIVVGVTLGPPIAESGGLVRFEADGSLDATFGSGGIATTAAGSIEDLELQPDGRIVVVGNVLGTGMLGPRSHVWVGRFDAQGTPDPTFGIGGVAELDRGVNDGATSLVVEPDGRIVIAGSTGGAPFVVPPDDFLLARVDGSGALDPTFGTGGVVVTDLFFGFSDSVQALVRQADGKLIAVGTLASTTVSFSGVAVARYDDGGALDPSFGVDGINVIGGGTEYAVAAALDGAGRLLVGGTYSGVLPFVMRLGTGGVLEPGWPFGTNQGADVGALAVQPDGRVVGLGSGVVLRLLTGDLCGNGMLDPGESCDDGNTAGGDCCSATCFADADGTSCDDGDLCTTGDTCAAGVCLPGSPPPAVPVCSRCDPATGLAVARPRAGCKRPLHPGRAVLRLGDGGARFGWRWNDGAATAAGELGDPLADPASTYDVCIFDESGPSPALVAASAATSNVAPDCARPPCWRRSASDGRLTYRTGTPNPTGLSTLQLRPGSAGRARLRLKGTGPVPGPLALPPGLPLRMQVWARTGACFEATYSSAGIRRSDARRFEAASE